MNGIVRTGVVPQKNVEGERLVDLWLERPWLSLVTGHADLDGMAYRLYLCLLYLTYLYLLGSASAVLLLLSPDKELTVKTIHVILLLLWAAVVLTCRITMDSSIRRLAASLKAGLYSYEGETDDDEVQQIKREGLSSLKRRSDLMARLYLFMGFSNLVLYPVSQLLRLGRGAQGPHHGLSPYLHQPLYMPFDTSTLLGYSVGELLNLIFGLLIYGLATSMNDIYISYTGGLATQLRLLTHSLRRLEVRASRLYMERTYRRVPGGLRSPSPPTDCPAFRECLRLCLRENIKHQRALIQFKEIGRVYIGTQVLNLLSVVAVVLATTLSLLLEKLPPNKLINYLLTGVAEVGYPFMLCYFGEEVLQESSKTFESLFETPWMGGEVTLKSDILFMMAYARRPMTIKTTVLNFTASLSTFGDIVSNMYRIINLIRQK